jgi:ABC-type glycerol-3-phosphate transport system substrate-binding protein
MIGVAPYGLAAASSPAVKDATFQLMKFFLQEDIQKRLMYETAWYPAMPHLWDLPNLHRSKKLAGRALSYAESPPMIPETEQWFMIMSTALQDVLLNNKPVKQTIDGAAEQTRQLLENAGYYK